MSVIRCQVTEHNKTWQNYRRYLIGREYFCRVPTTSRLCSSQQCCLVDNSIVDESSECVEDVGDEDKLWRIKLDHGDVVQQLGTLDHNLQWFHALIFLPRLYQRCVQLLRTTWQWHTLKKVKIAYTLLRSIGFCIPVLGSQPAGDVSHNPGVRLPLLSARPVVTPATLKRAATSFAARWTEARRV